MAQIAVELLVRLLARGRAIEAAVLAALGSVVGLFKVQLERLAAELADGRRVDRSKAVVKVQHVSSVRVRRRGCVASLRTRTTYENCITRSARARG